MEQVLSVSNLRSVRLQQVLTDATRLRWENRLQPVLARSCFGPSLFLLVRGAE